MKQLHDGTTLSLLSRPRMVEPRAGPRHVFIRPPQLLSPGRVPVLLSPLKVSPLSLRTRKLRQVVLRPLEI